VARSAQGRSIFAAALLALACRHQARNTSGLDVQEFTQLRSLPFLVAAVLLATPAAAGVQRFSLPNGERITLDGAYRKNNQVRVAGFSSSITSPAQVMQRALVRMAELTQARGLPRFAVVKVSDCGQMTMYGSAVNSQCRLLGQMLAEGENARPEGKREISYFRVTDVLGGLIQPDLSAPPAL
jgi:hypothetical protein